MVTTNGLAQRQSALAQANAARLHRSVLRHSLKDGPGASRLALAAVIREMPTWLEGAPVGSVLRWLPRLGKGPGGADAAVRRLLDAADVVSEVRLMRELSPRQREALAAAVEVER